MCMCMYAYRHIHTYMHAYILTYIRRHTYILTYIHMPTYLPTYIHIHMFCVEGLKLDVKLWPRSLQACSGAAVSAPSAA